MFSNSQFQSIKGVPLYVQIRENIRNRITGGELSVGTLLPSEDELASEFGVSRMTLRRAIDDLVAERLLIRKQGMGTMVASQKVVRDYTRLTGFYEDAINKDQKPSSKVLEFKTIEADEELAEKLMLKPGEKVFFIKRLRILGGNNPAALHTLYIPQSRCTWLPKEDLDSQSLMALYESHGLEIDWGKQLVEAREATPEQAEIFGIKEGAPVLYFERITYTKENIPIEKIIAVSPAGLVSINLILKR